MLADGHVGQVCPPVDGPRAATKGRGGRSVPSLTSRAPCCPPQMNHFWSTCSPECEAGEKRPTPVPPPRLSRPSTRGAPIHALSSAGCALRSVFLFLYVR